MYIFGIGPCTSHKVPMHCRPGVCIASISGHWERGKLFRVSRVAWNRGYSVCSVVLTPPPPQSIIPSDYSPLVCSVVLTPPSPPQSIIPSDYRLSDREKSNICYLSFPDSNSGELCV